MDLNPYQRFYQREVWQAERERWTSLFDRLVRFAGIPAPVVEFAFHPTRAWRFDRAWPKDRLAVEIEGGIWMKGKTGHGGAHTLPTNVLRDMEKYNAAVLLGWRVLRFADTHLNSPYAIESVKEALKGGASWTNP